MLYDQSPAEVIYRGERQIHRITNNNNNNNNKSLFPIAQFLGAAQNASQQQYTIHLQTKQATMSALKTISRSFHNTQNYVTEQTIKNVKDPIM